MKRVSQGALLGTALVYSFAFGGSAIAQDVALFGGRQLTVERVIPGVGEILLPESSRRRPEDLGLRAHTHYRIFKPINVTGPTALPLRSTGVSPAMTMGETPASMACVYKVVAQAHGCNPNIVTRNAGGGSQAIGIVDAYHNPTALADLQTFSTQYGLPAPHLKVVYCSSTTCAGVSTPPPSNQDWAGEIALDIQWAHAMAPHAKIILVEANSNSFVDLLRAEDRAAQLVHAAGGGQVSNSWGGGEFGGQTAFDSHFVKSKVVFFASTGDHKCSGAPNCVDVEYPSTSPNVIAVGGTTVNRANNGNFQKETAWIDTGGGISSVYPRPSFQNVVHSKVGAMRGVPDVAWNADPESGVPVYCSAGSCGSSGGFFQFGGTSLSSPAVAAMTNNAGKFRASGDAQHKALYKGYGGDNFSDVVGGQCGNGPSGAFVTAKKGWDACTGIGTPNTLDGL